MIEKTNLSENFSASVTRKINAIPDLNIIPMPGVILGIPIVRDKTEGGIVIPESAQDGNIPKVTIVAVGDGVNGLDVGDVVHYAPYTNQVPFLTINGVQVVKLFMDEIVGKQK
jgi:co-chaperonin GroES (HSP10)